MNYFERTITALCDAGANFVVIGGVAIAAYGSAHVTFDLDICYDRHPNNIQRLVKALTPYHPHLRGAPSDLPFIFDYQSISRGLNFTLTTELGDLDLMGEVAGIGPYKEAVARSITLELFGRPCQVLSLEGLIAAKRAAGRARDLSVIPELEALRELQAFLPGEADDPGKSTEKSSPEGKKHKDPKPD